MSQAHAPDAAADREVTSIQELARNLSEPPLNFTEGYFPTRLAVDAINNSGPAVVAHRLHRGALAEGPVLTINAGEGMGIDPLTRARQPQTIVLPGYAHLDVVTAAALQNNGQSRAGLDQSGGVRGGPGAVGCGDPAVQGVRAQRRSRALNPLRCPRPERPSRRTQPR